MNMWNDTGPISQGKILTDILQNRKGDAKTKLHGWTVADLRTLRSAIEELHLLIENEILRRKV